MQMTEGRQLFPEGSPVVEEGSEHSSTGKVSDLTCTLRGASGPRVQGGPSGSSIPRGSELTVALGRQWQWGQEEQSDVGYSLKAKLTGLDGGWGSKRGRSLGEATGPSSRWEEAPSPPGGAQRTPYSVPLRYSARTLLTQPSGHRTHSFL